MVSPQVTSVYPFPWELSPQVASGHSLSLELSSRSHILGFPASFYCVKYEVFDTKSFEPQGSCAF